MTGWFANCQFAIATTELSASNPSLVQTVTGLARPEPSKKTSGVQAAMWLLIFMSCVFSADAMGQSEEVSEAISELDAEIRAAERRLEFSELESQRAKHRILTLREMRQFVLAGIRQEQELEGLEEQRGAREAIERLESKLAETERQLELREALLRWGERKDDVLAVLREISREEMPAVYEQARALMKESSEVERLLRKLAGTPPNELVDRDKEWEERIELRGERFDLVMESSWIQIELSGAEENGDEDEADRLRDELRHLKAELEIDESEDASAHGTELIPERSTKRDMPKKIEVTQQELKNAASLDFETEVLPDLKATCFDCHGDGSASGDLDIAQLSQQRPFVVNKKHWDNIIQQLAVRSMPPADTEQPSEEVRRRLVAWLTNNLDSFDYATVSQPGHEAARRLTRDEYNHTIRDLVGMDIRPADRFPADMTASSGFRNSANSLFFLPITLERFIGAAEFVVDEAFPESGDPDLKKGDCWERLLGTRSLDDPKDVRILIAGFASRAFRRPIEEKELIRLLKYFEQRRSRGQSPRQAFRDVIQAVLISPSFLIRTEKTVGTGRIDDYELASRLSYFLWASMPDDRLFQLASNGDLSDPAVLRQQVDRMLDDPKAVTLGSLFAGQWLGTEKLDRLRPDQIDNPWATDSLVEAMQIETAMLFNEMVKDNLTLDTLLTSEFTFVNEELAKHYGLNGVRGKAMRRVSLQGTPRRGVLGHASVLAITSFPGRTSPVLRGNWILSELLGTPPPPPPPNVSEFDERIAENDRLTQKQKLELHRRNPNCYTCHSQIDPLGFSLSKFDWFGRYAPRHRGRPIDTKGQMPDGATVDGLANLAETLVKRRMPQLSRQLTRKLLSYAIGRQLDYHDEATIRELVLKFSAGGRHVRDLVHQIVQTDTFQINMAERGE